METIYKINPELSIPIYQQLVDAICVAIKNGSLAMGEQLPTVQEMVEKVGIARGTVKRVYDELERIELVEKVQGRGTFVKYKPILQNRKTILYGAFRHGALQLRKLNGGIAL